MLIDAITFSLRIPNGRWQTARKHHIVIPLPTSSFVYWRAVEGSERFSFSIKLKILRLHFILISGAHDRLDDRLSSYPNSKKRFHRSQKPQEIGTFHERTAIESKTSQLP